MSEGISRHVLSELIGSIYNCALDPSLWDETLSKLRDAMRFQTAALALWNPQTGNVLIQKTVGISPSWLEELPKHVPEIQYMVEKFSAGLSHDEPHVLSRHVPAEYQSTSPYVQACRAAGMVDLMEFFLLSTRERVATFGFSRFAQQGIVTDTEVDLGCLLLPHVRRAVTISNVLEARSIECSRLSQALDEVRCAVFLVDARGMIIHANEAAQSMLRDRGPVKDAGGCIQAKHRSATSELLSAIAIAAKNEAGIGKTGLSIRLTHGEITPVFAHVLPLTGSILRTQLRSSVVAAIFVGVPPDEQDGARVVAQAYGLTPAETRLVASLLAGRTLAETARTLQIASSTANSHLKNIFTKTGLSRQTDLVRLGERLASPAGKKSKT